MYAGNEGNHPDHFPKCFMRVFLDCMSTFFHHQHRPSYIVMEVTISRCYHNDIVWAGSSNTEFIIDTNICFRNQIYIMKIEIIK